MKTRTSLLLLAVIVVCFSNNVHGQRRRPAIQKTARPVAAKAKEIGATAIVVDETLSVLRSKPSLFADPVQRMRRGRKVVIQGVAEADGVKFYKVDAPPGSFGWVQSDAVFGSFRPSDEERLARLV